MKKEHVLIAKHCPKCDNLIEVEYLEKEGKKQYDFSTARCSKCSWAMKKN